MLKLIKVRIYPTKIQEEYISSLHGSYRFVYNQCLALKIQSFQETKSSLGLKELGKYFHNDLTKNPEYTWLNIHNTKVLKQSILNLLEAYKNFFVNGSGFPKFKTKNSKQSCRFPSDTISKLNTYLDNKITLTKVLKNIKFRCSKEYTQYLVDHKDSVRSATLIKTKTGKYFLSILVDGELSRILPPSTKSIGIDLGIKDFIVCSDGKIFENIKSIRSNEKALKRLQRQHCKKVKGSKNRERARIKLAVKHEKIRNKKVNYLHQVVNKLLDENQVVVCEDLNVQGMMKNHNLAKSISELSLCEFKRILLYKAEWYGRTVVEIDRWFPSSKLCSHCGHKYQGLKLSERQWKCSSCGTHHDRDLNAAKNIEREGLRLLSSKDINNKIGNH